MRALARLGVAFAIFMGSIVGVNATPASAHGGEVLLVCPEMTDSVVRLYSAYFLRAPDASGIDFWIREYSENNRTLAEMSEFFSDSTEFLGLYGSLNNRQFVDLIYQNILGRQGEASGVDFWTGRLDQGLENRGEVMLKFSEGPEYVSLTGTYPPLAGHYQWYPEGTTWVCGTENAIVPINKQSGGYVDGIAFNFGDTSSENFIAATLGASQEFNDRIVNETVPAGQFYYFWDFPIDRGRGDSDTRYLEIAAIDANRQGFFWTVVFYPTSIGSARGGWDDLQLEETR